MKLTYGVGSRLESKTKKDGKIKKSYVYWHSMLNRCYKKQLGAKVCDEWLVYDEFEKWFNVHYIPEYHLDKDIQGGKVYSPESCFFIPKRINNMITSCKGVGKGSVRTRTDGNTYSAQIYKYGKLVHIGSFGDAKSAETAYKREKESYVSTVAIDYYNKGLIDDFVCKALLNWNA